MKTNSFFLPNLPASTRLILRFLWFLMVAFTLTRILFYALYGDLAIKKITAEILRSFMVGMRFDISTAALLLSPWILLSHLPFTERRGEMLRRILTPCLVLVGVLASLIAISDCVYYAHAAKRFSYEPLLFFQIGDKIVEFAFGEHPVLVPFLLACVFLFWGIVWHWARHKSTPPDQCVQFTRVRIVLWGVLLLGLSIIGIRGGLQNTPLRIGDAYFSDDTVINQASLNPVYTFLQSLKDDRTIYESIPAQKALTTVQAAVADPDEQFISERYPLARKFINKQETSANNVVLIICESLSAEFVGTYGDPMGATPNLDKIASEGVVFERFLSSGSRTSHGIFATLFSVPAQLGSPVMHTSFILNNYRSMAQVLKDHGYETIFIYGGIYEFTNAYGVLRNSGFEKIIGEPLPANPPIKPRTWGYDDENMFARLHHELSMPGDKPRFVVLFTQNLHGREVPKNFLKLNGGAKYSQETRHHAFYNLEYYTDWCIGQFFSDAKEQPYFNNTIFAITADHSNHTNPNLYENYHIPFILYAPWLLSPARYNNVGSQLDILPTIAGLLNLQAEHASFGRDLMRVVEREESGYAYLMLGDHIGWVEGPLILLDPLGESTPKLYNYIENPELTRDYAAQRMDLALLLRSKGRSFMQVSRHLLEENRIFPPTFEGTREHNEKRE